MACVGSRLARQRRAPAGDAMKQERVSLEMVMRPDGQLTINLVFLDTGEIRQKRRSIEWLMKRLWLYERRRWREEPVLEAGFSQAWRFRVTP